MSEGIKLSIYNKVIYALVSQFTFRLQRQCIYHLWSVKIFRQATKMCRLFCSNAGEFVPSRIINITGLLQVILFQLLFQLRNFSVL